LWISREKAKRRDMKNKCWNCQKKVKDDEFRCAKCFKQAEDGKLKYLQTGKWTRINHFGSKSPILDKK